MNIDIKVGNKRDERCQEIGLSANDIERCAGVIFAADKKVEMDRFNGKTCTSTPGQ